jgi:uncharacterized membrane protein YhaH (DUF805 family)
MNNLLSFEGRIGRQKYFLTLLIFGVGFQLVNFAITTRLDSPIVFSIVWTLGMMVFFAFQIVKRLHDLGKSGTHYWLLFIPLYNIYLTFLLLFKKGEDGENQFGSDPLN